MDPPSNKARLPLTNMLNIVSQRSPKHNVAVNVHIDGRRKQVLDESFFMYRKSQDRTLGCADPFAQLSDEVLLQIFRCLPKKSLLRCGQVNHRFNRVSKDETLWVRMDLSGRCIPSICMFRNMLNRGLVVLRMSQTSICSPVPEPNAGFPSLSKLQYLDLSMSTIGKDVVRDLLASCRSLLKLSLENVPLNEAICDEIAANRRLESLNLTMCSGISDTGMQNIAKALMKLQSLNVGWAHLSAEAVCELLQNVTTHMLRLNLAGCRVTLTNSSLEVLLKRCPRLLELDLSDCSQLTSEAIPIICKFRKLEYLSLSRCYSINVTAYLNLINLRSLQFLDLFGIMSDSAVERLKQAFPKVGINIFYHSAVARPTVGTRRTSIWGVRTRD